jgi:hypothetical protein
LTLNQRHKNLLNSQLSSENRPIYLLELSSLRSQLECWNNGTMEYWVLGN